MGSKFRVADLIVEEEFVLSGVAGQRIYLRNKRRADLQQFTPSRSMLFVHGATYASTITFDMALDGFSWMDQLAAAGFDCWLMDIRGYGRSDRPAEMAEAPDANGPIMHTLDAIADLAVVVDHIRAKRDLAKLQLLGYSWGTVITGAYTARHNDKVERLALYACVYVREGGSLIGSKPPAFSYRLVSADAARQRWLHGMSDEDAADIIDPDWMAAWLAATLTSDPQAANHSPPQIRAPSGVVDDATRTWGVGKPYYDPAGITVPTLVVVGDRDMETPPEKARELFRQLRNVTHKRFVEIGGGSHSLLLERRREQLFKVVESFLLEDFSTD